MAAIFITIDPMSCTMPVRSTASKAAKLLYSLLDNQQRKELEQEGRFTVIGGATGRKYRIETFSLCGNVKELLFGAVRNSYCLQVAASVQFEDHFIAQMLLLRYDEKRFLRTARA